MQCESDVCESVCEAGVLVHGGRRCRACHLCVRALRVSVCVSLAETLKELPIYYRHHIKKELELGKD